MTWTHSSTWLWVVAAAACDAGVAELDRPMTAAVAPAARCKRIDPPLVAGLETQFGEIVATRDGKRLYIARGFREDVVEVSTYDLAIQSTIRLGGQPQDLALRAQPETLAVSVNESPAQLVTIDIDPSSDSYRRATTTVLTTNGSLGLAYRPDGAELYVLTQRPETGFVNVLDASTLKVIESIPAGALASATPMDVAFTANSAKAYIPIFQSDPAHNIAVVRSASRRISYVNVRLGPPSTKWHSTPPTEADGYSTPIQAATVRHGDTERVWVIAHQSVFVIDPITDSVIRKFHSTDLNGLCASPDGTQVLILGKDVPLAIYDGMTGAPTRTLRPHIHGYRCTFSVDGCHIYITDLHGYVHRVDPDDVMLD